MKEDSWEECIESNSARKVTPDPTRANSLKETAQARMDAIEHITEKNCNFVFEDCYSSLLELMQALVITKGLRVTNHVCLGYYLRDVLKREELFSEFDNARYKRNSLIYYGNRMDFETAKQAIDSCKKLMREIRTLLK